LEPIDRQLERGHSRKDREDESVRNAILVFSVSVVVGTLLGATSLMAQRKMLVEEFIRLDGRQPQVSLSSSDYQHGDASWRVRGSVGPELNTGMFRGFRIEFNTDTTPLITFRTLQERQLFVLRDKRLKCKIAVTDYTSQVGSEDPLLGTERWLVGVQLKISVWGLDQPL
jgi:hypothetical protein